ncbi:MAG: 2-C-methyl-D-erythritol 4-phosphate cytidylyltransferase, partial [Gammaproteobacteria bacterium]|nr:2-C-methyl-D-erythritol 4-phosphate cytidylyltransferase [Gammaproteobacteria bacterium]
MSNSKLWVIIPAAGVGKRMLVNHPKQYLQINDKTILEYTLESFDRAALFAGIVVAVSQDDEYWSALSIKSDVPLYQTDGGS